MSVNNIQLTCIQFTNCFKDEGSEKSTGLMVKSSVSFSFFLIFGGMISFGFSLGTIPLSTNFLNSSLISILLGKTGDTVEVGTAGGTYGLVTGSNCGITFGIKGTVVAEKINKNKIIFKNIIFFYLF